MFVALPPAPPAVVITVDPAADPVMPPGEHRVEVGETLGSIALRYGVSRRALIWANDLGSGHELADGQLLRIPTPTVSPGAGAAASPAGSSTQSVMVVPPDRVRDAVMAAADRAGVDRSLALAVAWNESRWRQDRISHKGAVGAMQCLPRSGRWMSERVGRTLNLENVDDNATCGVMLLKTFQENSGGDETLALAAYNQGMTSVKTNGVYPVTMQYVQSVQWLRDQIASSAQPPRS